MTPQPNPSYNLSIVQGETFELGVNLVYEGLLNLNSCQVIGQIRSRPNGSNPIDLTAQIETDSLNFLLSLTSEQTAQILAGAYVWDCFLIEPNGRSTRLLFGECFVLPRVTVWQ